MVENTLEDVFQKIPGTGWLHLLEAEVLWEGAVKTEGPILEVGCYHGRSTVLLSHFGRPIYTVDPFVGFAKADPTGKKTKEAFRKNTRGIDNITLFEQRIEEWEPRPCGYAYLDGLHTYQGTLVQIDKALSCNPTLIVVHDVNDKGGGLQVKRACLERLGPWLKRQLKMALFEVNSCQK